MAEALADARRHHKERLHDNQPEWERHERGALRGDGATRVEGASGREASS